MQNRVARIGMTARVGFTVIELLVVMAITAVLVSLVTAGVMSLRAAARRMDCLSRMSQVGKALHGYEAAHQAFPAARVSWPVKGPVDEFSPQTRLLPHLDQAAVYNKINFDRGSSFTIPFFYPSPRYGDFEHFQYIVPVFNCPSDSPDVGGNYRVCTGSTAYAWSRVSPRAPGTVEADGAFTLFKAYTAGDFTDGMSHTVAVSEKTKGLGLQQPWGRGSFWYSGLTEVVGFDSPTEQVVLACASLKTIPPVTGTHAGFSWMIGCYDYTFYNHVLTPNSKIRDCSSYGVGDHPLHDAIEGVFTANSYHAGGVNCVFMDGSGRFVSDSIDLGIWRALASRAGNEPNHDF